MTVDLGLRQWAHRRMAYARSERYHSNASDPSIFSTKTENHNMLVPLNFLSVRHCGVGVVGKRFSES